MKKILFVLMTSSAITSSAAQDTLSLKLQDALDYAIRSNRDVALATLDQETAATNFSQTNAMFLPQITLSYTAMATDNPLNAFGFKLQQQSVSPSDFNPQLLNNPSTTQNYLTRIEWNQPLLNLEMAYRRKAADHQINVYYYRVERIKQFVMFEVTKAYAQLQLSYQAANVLAESLRTVNAIFETSKNYFEKGYLQKSDLLLVQVQVATAESKLAEANSNVRNASDHISFLMGIKSGPVYLVEPMKKNDQPEILETQVPEQRADLNAMKVALKSQATMIRSEKMSYLPKLNAFANYMFNDKNALGFGSNSYLVGAQFSYTLFNGTSRYHQTAQQRIAHARIEQQLNYQKEQSQLELNRTFRQLQDAQVSLHQHETSVGQAAEALRILQNRFQHGLVSMSDLLQSQSALSEQKLLLSQAIFNYNTALDYVQFQTIVSDNK